jgi:predicted CoA-binding protein
MTAMSDWKDRIVSDDAGLVDILTSARTVAVLGAKTGAHEPAFYVPEYLAARGYRILPVNPGLVGQSLFGVPVVRTLADLTEPADVIDVFRRPEFLPGHAREILALPWRPATVWFQLGIRHDGAAELLARAGIRVVQDRCMMPEHRRLLGWGGTRRTPPTPPPA